MDPRGRKCEEDGAEGNICTQEEGIEVRIVLGVMFGPKWEEEREGYCWGECLDPRRRK